MQKIILKKEYNIWYHMLGRCYNNSDAFYHVYGGADVTVCTRWFNLSNFLEDLGKNGEL